MHPMPSRWRRALPKSISPCGAIRLRWPRVPSSSRSAMGQPDLFAGIQTPGMHVAGIDEAGRGPLAGPAFAAAVILDPARPIDGLDDSTKLTAPRRENTALRIREPPHRKSVARGKRGTDLVDVSVRSTIYKQNLHTLHH